MTARERCGACTSERTFCGEKADWLFFKELVRCACFAQLRPLWALLLDVYILNSVAVPLVRERGIVWRPPAYSDSSWVWKANTPIELYLFSIHFAPLAGQGRGECFTNLYSYGGDEKRLTAAGAKRAGDCALRRSRSWLHAAMLGQCHPALRADNGEQSHRWRTWRRSLGRLALHIAPDRS